MTFFISIIANPFDDMFVKQIAATPQQLDKATYLIGLF